MLAEACRFCAFFLAGMAFHSDLLHRQILCDVSQSEPDAKSEIGLENH